MHVDIIIINIDDCGRDSEEYSQIHFMSALITEESLKWIL